MGGSDLSDFLRQVPIGMILAPIFFGGIYILIMAIIFRRAAERRRKARAARGEVIAERPRTERPLMSRLGQLRSLGGFVPTQAAPDTPLPEPDLDLLANPIVVPKPPPDVVDAEFVTDTGQQYDWIAGVSEALPTPPAISAVVPQSVPQEAVMPTKLNEPTPVETGDTVEVMRIYRDLNDGSLIIQMGNQRYRTLDEVKNPDLARRFSAVVRELWAMVSGSAVRDLPPITPLPAASSSATPPGLLSRTATTETDASKPNRLSRLTQQLRGGKSQKPEEPQGIAYAIEEYLQFRLVNSPEFATRSIHIRPSVDHGVSIEVDGHYYESINDVVDADVREFLSTVTKEWEARH
jgi:hypothetical protein